jgi:quercetin dioxygenase-like cupin family protein
LRDDARQISVSRHPRANWEDLLDSWNIAELDVQPHKPEVLRTDKEARVIAIHLPAGEQLQDHQTHERGYLVVVSGQVEVGQGGENTSGGPGFLAVFDPNERREVTAKEDSRLALILGPWPGEGHPRGRSA